MAITGIVQQDGTVLPASDLTRPIKDRIKQARSHRKQFEPNWQSNLAFASGKHWLVYDRRTRTQRKIEDMNPMYRGKELRQFDLINEYRGTVLGELGSDDDRPELLLQHDDKAAEEFQGQVNRALGFAWDYEAQADVALAEVDRLTIDMGTAAIRCRFDTAAGPVTPTDVPHQDGKPLLDPLEAHEAVLGAQQRGEQLDFHPINEGAIRLEVLSAMNLLTPPGVTHERLFPWECVVRPTLISDVVAEYGDAAAGLQEDKDIASTIGFSTTGSESTTAYRTAGETRSSRLRDHVWLFTYYEKPTKPFPQGRVFVFAGNDLRLIHMEERLPYVGPDGVYRSGISYFHWWRVTGRFWSRALIEPMKDIQFQFNRRKMQIFDIIDKGQPAVFVEKDSRARKRTDLALELIELDKNERVPVVFPGVSPGEYFYRDLEELRNDMQHATGVRAPTMGENPANVNTYSQLALLREADQVKRQVVVFERRLAISRMVEDMVYDMRNYWGPEKQLRLAGDDDRMQAELFNASRIPDFYIVKTAKGSPKPRTQAAMLKMIEDIWNGAINSGQPLPLKWLKESYEAGEPQALPESPSNDQHDKAQLENHQMLLGQPILPPAYYDPPEVHIPVHRTAQIQADLAGDVAASRRIEAHVQQHFIEAAKNIAEQQQLAPSVGALPPGAPQPQAPSPSPSPPSSQSPQGA